VGSVSLRTPEERAAEEERLVKTTTQMYRAPEMVDLYMRDELTEKTDVWVGVVLRSPTVLNQINFLFVDLPTTPIPHYVNQLF